MCFPRIQVEIGKLLCCLFYVKISFLWNEMIKHSYYVRTLSKNFEDFLSKILSSFPLFPHFSPLSIPVFNSNSSHLRMSTMLIHMPTTTKIIFTSNFPVIIFATEFRCLVANFIVIYHCSNLWIISNKIQINIGSHSSQFHVLYIWYNIFF